MKNNRYKKLILFVLLLCSYNGYSQKESLELGVLAGKSSYFGDLTTVNHFESIVPNTLGGFLRYNFHSRFACRLNYAYTGLEISGNYHGSGYNFAKNINDFNLSVEVNYLRFMPGSRGHRWTSYVGFGLGAMTYNYYYDPYMLSQLTPNPGYILPSTAPHTEVEMPIYAPVTFGVKAQMNKKLTVGAEIIVKKIFSSTLDDLSNPIGFTASSSMHNHDLIPVFAVHISYKLIIFAKDCYGLD
ncbi:MAG: DUF6089 family protein [Bacteroidales bacterium]